MTLDGAPAAAYTILFGEWPRLFGEWAGGKAR